MDQHWRFEKGDYIREDGAKVWYDPDHYWANPLNPNHKGWVIQPPNARHIINDIYETYTVRRKNSRFHTRIKFKSAENAMKRCDELWPFVNKQSKYFF